MLTICPAACPLGCQEGHFPVVWRHEGGLPDVWTSESGRRAAVLEWAVSKVVTRAAQTPRRTEGAEPGGAEPAGAGLRAGARGVAYRAGGGGAGESAARCDAVGRMV